jgi:hypothetical protein
MRSRALAIAVVTAAITLTSAGVAQAQLVVNDLDHGQTPTTLAQALAGSGVSVSNVTYTGANRAAGSFTGGTGIIGFGSGIILDSGNVQTITGDGACSGGVEGPNDCNEGGGPAGNENTTAFGTAGDADLDALTGATTNDAAVLEFDFVPTEANLQFRFVFSSEEYNDFANSSFNDVFGFFVNDANCALVPGTTDPISINTINNGNPGGDMTPHNANLYRDNVRPSPSINTQMDGLTTVLTCSATVNPGQSNHLKLAIADTTDFAYDSAVFLQAGSLTSGGKVSARGTFTDTTGAAVQLSAANNCTESLSTRGFQIRWTGGGFTKTSVTTSSCTTNSALPASPAGFNQQTGTAAGNLLAGGTGTVSWTFKDGGPGGIAADKVNFTVRNAGGAIVKQVNEQSGAALSGAPGGVWTFVP